MRRKSETVTEGVACADAALASIPQLRSTDQLRPVCNAYPRNRQTSAATAVDAHTQGRTMRAARSWAACVLLTLVCHAEELGWQARDGALTAQVHLAQLRPVHARTRAACAYHAHPLGLPRAYRCTWRSCGPTGPSRAFRRARTSCSRLARTRGTRSTASSCRSGRTPSSSRSSLSSTSTPPSWLATRGLTRAPRWAPTTRAASCCPLR